MTASEISKLLHGKRIGHGRYLAKCPAHHDHKPSLNIRDGKTCVLLKCWPGCSVEEVVSAMGLKMVDLWYSKTTISQEANSRLNDERRLESLDYNLGIAILAQALPDTNPHFWESMEHSIREERKQLIFKIYPARKTAYDLQMKIRSVGWESMWDEYWRDHPREDRYNPIVQPAQTSLFGGKS